VTSRAQEIRQSDLAVVDRPSVPRVGWIAGDGKSLIVDYSKNTRGPLAARTTVALEGEALARAARERASVLLLFENDDPGLPIVVGLIRSETPLLDAALEPMPARVPTEARLDGRRVVLEGHDEIELRCGRAVILLRRGGEVVIRGVSLKTEASGINRIRGGKVQIN